MQIVKFQRYVDKQDVKSPLSLLDDALDLLSLLTVPDVVARLLRQGHGKTTAEAKELAARIASHARVTDKYARASLVMDPEISFLPGYYAVLNLTKIVSLCGPYSSEFDQQTRWHGATYDFRGIKSQKLLTDSIRVRAGGTLALYYKTLTGEAISGDHRIPLINVYEKIRGVEAEFNYITGANPAPLLVRFEAEPLPTGLKIEATVRQTASGNRWVPYSGNVRTLPFFVGYRKKPKSNGVFIRSVQPLAGQGVPDAVAQTLNFAFLKNLYGTDTWVGVKKTGSLSLPEDFCSALAFFHLSSVCRYNPEFLSKLSSGEHWPMLLALRRHALYQFVVSSYSFMIQSEYHSSGY